MQLAIIENNTIKQIGDSRELFPNVSFTLSGIEEEFLITNSAMEVISWIPVAENETLDTVEPYIQEGKVYTIRPRVKTQEELLAEYNLLAESIRFRRNQLLKESDWTQVADAPVDKIAWATYRQALRDITTQTGFPFNVYFPVNP